MQLCLDVFHFSSKHQTNQSCFGSQSEWNLHMRKRGEMRVQWMFEKHRIYAIKYPWHSVGLHNSANAQFWYQTHRAVDGEDEENILETWLWCCLTRPLACYKNFHKHFQNVLNLKNNFQTFLPFVISDNLFQIWKRECQPSLHFNFKSQNEM